MMTLEDIRNIEFSKGRGYRADEVDDFIDECVEAMQHLLQENAETNRKMKVLADKVAEYRNDEDSIRSALLSAQRTGDSILREAESKAKMLLEQAQQEAEAKRLDLLAAVEEQQAELVRTKQEVAAFKEKMLALYKEHLALIKVLPEIPEEPATADEQSEEPVTVAEPEESVVVVPDAEETATAVDDEDMKPLSRFSDLKFGNDYDIHSDTDEEDEDDNASSKGLFRKKK